MISKRNAVGCEGGRTLFAGAGMDIDGLVDTQHKCTHAFAQGHLARAHHLERPLPILQRGGGRRRTPCTLRYISASSLPVPPSKTLGVSRGKYTTACTPSMRSPRLLSLLATSEYCCTNLRRVEVRARGHVRSRRTLFPRRKQPRESAGAARIARDTPIWRRRIAKRGWTRELAQKHRSQ
jgi:hypothetical protein